MQTDNKDNTLVVDDLLMLTFASMYGLRFGQRSKAAVARVGGGGGWGWGVSRRLYLLLFKHSHEHLSQKYRVNRKEAVIHR